MNYKCIDTKIRPLIKALNRKGLVTADSCAGIGPSITYSGRMMSKSHRKRASWCSPYFTILKDESNYSRLHQLICESTSIIVNTQLSSYPLQLCKVNHTHYENINKVEFRINDFLCLPLIFPDIKTVTKPTNFYNYWQNKWISKLQKIAERL